MLRLSARNMQYRRKIEIKGEEASQTRDPPAPLTQMNTGAVAKKNWKRSDTKLGLGWSKIWILLRMF